jgi:hypothetical protein
LPGLGALVAEVCGGSGAAGVCLDGSAVSITTWKPNQHTDIIIFLNDFLNDQR